MMKKLAPAFIVLAGILWGSIGIFVRSLNSAGFASMQISAVRCLTTLIFLSVALLLFDRSAFRVRLRDLWCFAGTGICSIVFFNYCYFKTISEASLSVAAVLLYTAPAMVILMSIIFFREPVSLRKLLSLLFAFIGCVLVSGIIGVGVRLETRTVLSGVGSAFGYALYSIFGRYAINRGYKTPTLLFYTFLFACIGILPLCNVTQLAPMLLSGKTVAVSFALGFFATTLPYLFYTLGLSFVEAGNASIMASVEPVAATLVGIIVFQESLTPEAVAGIMSVLVSILILNVGIKKKGSARKVGEK